MIFELKKVLLNYEVWTVTFNTLKITGLAAVLALCLGLPISFLLAFNEFPLKRFIISIINTGMGLPPVVVGLFISIIFWRSGIMGNLNLMYTPTAMVIAEFIIALPLVTALSFASLQTVKGEIIDQFYALGATKLQIVISLLKESRLSSTAAVIAGYGAIVSEVGAALMVGGNIKDQTRVLTTAIVLETRKGNFKTALSLGIILLILAFIVNYYLTKIQQREEKWREKL